MNNNSQKPSGEKTRGGVRVPVALMLVVCMSASAYLGVLGVQGYLEQKTGVDFYGSLASSAAASPGALPAPATAAEATEPARATLSEAELAALPLFGPTLANTEPSAPRQEAPQLPRSEKDFEAIWRTCPDVVGWVTIEGTKIDYPIVHGDDNDFYLTHLPDKTKNEAGSIMMDVANLPDFTDDVSILHGHHMRSGAMFGDLDLYKDKAYYLEHPMMRLYTPQGDYDVEIFAVYSVDGSNFAYPTNFSDEDGFNEFYHRAKTRTPYTIDVEAAYGDRMLMLSTCAYSYDYERLLVVGKILEPQE